MIKLFKRKVKESKYHTSAKKLKLIDFIPALCNDDYSGLIISGTPTENQLKGAFDTIYAEYTELTGSNIHYTVYLNILKEYGESKGRHVCLCACANALQIGYNAEAEKILNDMGYSCDFASKGKATTAYLDELKRIKKHIQANNIMYQESMQKAAKFLEGKAGKKLTESEFMGYVAAVSKFTGFNISINSVRVAEFAALANYMTISNKKQNNGGRKN